MTSQEVNAAIRHSLGLPEVVESKPTVSVEGHVCEFPLWSFSKESMEMLGAMPPQASPPPQGPCPDTSA
jgi:hypothetical protein